MVMFCPRVVARRLVPVPPLVPAHPLSIFDVKVLSHRVLVLLRPLGRLHPRGHLVMPIIGEARYYGARKFGIPIQVPALYLARLSPLRVPEHIDHLDPPNNLLLPLLAGPRGWFPQPAAALLVPTVAAIPWQFQYSLLGNTSASPHRSPKRYNFTR